MINLRGKGQISKSPVDGKFRRWHLVWASQLGMIDQEEANMKRSDGSSMDWLVPVCTGVADKRREFFK